MMRQLCEAAISHMRNQASKQAKQACRGPLCAACVSSTCLHKSMQALAGGQQLVHLLLPPRGVAALVGLGSDVVGPQLVCLICQQQHPPGLPGCQKAVEALQGCRVAGTTSVSCPCSRRSCRVSWSISSSHSLAGAAVHDVPQNRRGRAHGLDHVLDLVADASALSTVSFTITMEAMPCMLAMLHMEARAMDLSLCSTEYSTLDSGVHSHLQHCIGHLQWPTCKQHIQRSVAERTARAAVVTAVYSSCYSAIHSAFAWLIYLVTHTLACKQH